MHAEVLVESAIFAILTMGRNGPERDRALCLTSWRNRRREGDEAENHNCRCSGDGACVVPVHFSVRDQFLSLCSRAVTPDSIRKHILAGPQTS